jgi:hypothetical protein
MVQCMQQCCIQWAISKAILLTIIKIPWRWQPWSAETCKRRFCASVLYIASVSKVGFISWFLHYAWWHTTPHFLGRIDENHNAPQESPSPSTYSNWVHPRYMTEVFLLQSSRSTVTQGVLCQLYFRSCHSVRSAILGGSMQNISWDIHGLSEK